MAQKRYCCNGRLDPLLSPCREQTNTTSNIHTPRCTLRNGTNINYLPYDRKYSVAQFGPGKSKAVTFLEPEWTDMGKTKGDKVSFEELRICRAHAPPPPPPQYAHGPWLEMSYASTPPPPPNAHLQALDLGRPWMGGLGL